MYIVCIIEIFRHRAGTGRNQCIHHETIAVYGENQEDVSWKAENVFASKIKESNPNISETNIEVAIDNRYIEIGKSGFILTHPEMIRV